jgi:hypothetical protein
VWSGSARTAPAAAPGRSARRGLLSGGGDDNARCRAAEEVARGDGGRVRTGRGWWFRSEEKLGSGGGHGERWWYWRLVFRRFEATTRRGVKGEYREV